MVWGGSTCGHGDTQLGSLREPAWCPEDHGSALLYSGGDSGISPSSAGRSGAASGHEVHPGGHSAGPGSGCTWAQAGRGQNPHWGQPHAAPPPDFAQAQSQSRFFLGHSGDISPPSGGPSVPSCKSGVAAESTSSLVVVPRLKESTGWEGSAATPAGPFLSPSLG